MTAEHVQPDVSLVSVEQAAELQRAQLLETIAVAHMQSPAAYNPDDEIARKKSVGFQRSLPEGLTEQELSSLATRVGRIYKDDDKVDTATQVRFLAWLGSGFQVYGSDAAQKTAKNAEKVLMHTMGVRGKLGALSLMKQRIFSF